ncbi:MAG: ankyrin repeat domain-containing protein [Pikeienuella sp.]
MAEDQGYTRLISAIYAREGDLAPRVAGLIDAGEDPNAATDYGETPLNVAHRLGERDVVRLLLARGADPEAVGWGSLHLAVIAGDGAALARALPRADPMTRDRWGHTPFLAALAVGAVDLAAALAPLTPDDGRHTLSDGAPDIVIAEQWGQVEAVRWLLAGGRPVDAAGRYGGTALIAAAEHDHPAVVALLLEAGAALDAAQNISAFLRDLEREGDDVLDLGDAPDHVQTAMAATSSLEVAMLLLNAGAPPEAFEPDLVRRIVGADRIPARPVPPEAFDRARHPREGVANPEPVSEPFWEQMVRTGLSGYVGHETFGPGTRPYEIAAVWSHDRFGMTTTMLPDGRWVQIAGEHEDFYDPDFYIYNDVFLHDGRCGLTHCLYPHAVFPPTDFHTATLGDGAIWIVGNLGYPAARKPGETPVYRLDLAELSIAAVATTGTPPGWISRHRACLEAGALIVEGGQCWTGEALVAFEGRARLDLAARRWTSVA